LVRRTIGLQLKNREVVMTFQRRITMELGRNATDPIATGESG
jgi:hypothetical protein